MLLKRVVCLLVLMAALAIGAVIPNGDLKQLGNATLTKTYKNVLYFGDW
jgi:hypothetical protein